MDELGTNEKLERLEAYKAAFWPDAYDHDSHVFLTLADSYLALSCFSQARHLLELAIKNDPQNAILHYRLGEVYWRTDQLELAVEKFADAQFLDSEGKLAAGAAIDEIIEGPLKGNRGIGVLRKIIAKYPEHSTFKHSLAWACNLGNELPEAERLFRELLTHDLSKEGWGDCWREDIEMALSGVLRKKGDISASVALVEKALPRLGSHWSLEDVESKLADDYLELGRFEDALKIYLNWLSHAAPSVSLIGEGSNPHSAKDSRIYEIVKTGLLKILNEIEIAGIVFEDEGDFFTGRTDPPFFGKLYLALARCYEEKGETKEAKEAHDKAMGYFGKSGE